MNWVVISSAVAASALSLLLTSLTIRLSHRWRLLDAPDPRKVHKAPTPRLGGVGIIGAALIAGVPTFAWLVDTSTAEGWTHLQQYSAVVIGALVVFAVGVIDDLGGVSARLKLLTLLAASCVVCASGAGFHGLVYDFQTFIQFPWLSWLITALWITGMAIAFNFIDGLDGLAGGLAVMLFAVLGYFQLATGHLAPASASLALAGALVGFLYFNWRPAKTFMGDGGSLTLGYLIGALTVTANSDANLGTMRAMVVPSLAMSVALVDTALTLFRRRYEQRRSLFTAERGHIHHRLLDRGLRHHQVVILIHAVSAGAVLIGLFSLRFVGWHTMGGLALLVPLLWGLFHAAGSVRTGRMVAAIRRKRQIDRTSRGFRQSFESLQLEFDRDERFTEWWDTVCHAADQLCFSRVELPVTPPGPDHAAKTFRWINAPAESAAKSPWIDARIPIPFVGPSGGDSTAEIQIPIADSLESAGERLALFSRLIAENGAPSLARIYESDTTDWTAADREPTSRDPLPEPSATRSSQV